MKLWPNSKFGRVVAVFFYCVLLFAVIAAFGGLKQDFKKGASGASSPAAHASTLQPVKTLTPAPATSTPTPAASEVDHIHCVVIGATDASSTLEKDGDLPTHFKTPGDVRQVLDETASVYTCASALMGHGEVTVKMFINGKLMSSAAAVGGYNTAITTIVHRENGTWAGAIGTN